jgi:hypothetical protein
LYILQKIELVNNLGSPNFNIFISIALVFYNITTSYILIVRKVQITLILNCLYIFFFFYSILVNYNCTNNNNLKKLCVLIGQWWLSKN